MFLRKAKKSKAPRPATEVVVDCPSCKARLHIKTYKTRKGAPPARPEYEVRAEVTVEMELFDPGRIRGQVTAV